jgi:hypothetical protein
MSTCPISCGYCEKGVSPDVVSGWPMVGSMRPAQCILWLKCPHCGKGSVKTADGTIYPTLHPQRTRRP